MAKRLENIETCGKCQFLMDSLLKEYEGLSAAGTIGLARLDFEEMMGDNDCLENLICLPLTRLNGKRTPINSR
jgi:hypothetical protein